MITKKDAETPREEDRRQFELAEARNKGQHLIYQVEKDMKENTEKLTDADRQPLNSAIDKLKSAVTDTARADRGPATTELEQAYQGFSKTLYEKTAASGGSGADAGRSAPAPRAARRRPLDAEFEVK
ncbi:MAG: Hsp70 family protein [Pirellulales bacterium]